MAKKYRTGYTQGVYDMFHIGHLNLINRAKEQCERLIVGVNSDALVVAYKHKKPVISEEERVEIIRNIRAVDEAHIVHTLDKSEALARFHFDAIFIGDDWKGNPRWEQTRLDMQRQGAELVFLPYTHGISSTALRQDVNDKVND